MIAANIDDNLIPPESRMISYLPTSHVASLLTDVFIMFIQGGCTHFANKDALKGNLLIYLTTARPNSFLGVPRIYEKI